MTGMEAVLAAHGVRAADTGGTLCVCGDGMWRGGPSRARHVAMALEAAGFGSMHDAWEEGHEAAVATECDSYYVHRPNPYPSTEGAS